MCSILGIFGLQPRDDLLTLRREALECSQRLRHRCPDWSGVYLDEGAVHERLAIVDREGRSQPLRSADGELVEVSGGDLQPSRTEARPAVTLQTPHGFRLRNNQRIVTGPSKAIHALRRLPEPNLVGADLHQILRDAWRTGPALWCIWQISNGEKE